MERTEGNRIISRIEPISFFISELPDAAEGRRGRNGQVSIEQFRTFVQLMRFAVMEDKGAEV